MSRTKPLLVSEIPVGLRKFIDFNSQRTQSTPKAEMQVDVECPICLRKRPVKVANIRASKRKCRFTALCVNCVPKDKTILRGLKQSDSPRWKGGRIRLKTGYVLAYAPDHPARGNDRYVFEHRLVMEKKIGRYLLPGEIVHHKNGLRHDNRAENLELWQKGHPTAQRPGDMPHCPTCTCSN